MNALSNLQSQDPTVQALQQAMYDLQHQLQHQQQVNAQHAADYRVLARNQGHLSEAQNRRDRVKHDLPEHIANSIPPHLQCETTLTEVERKRILGAMPEFNGFPEAIKDANGLATKAIPEGPTRKFVLTNLPKFQQDSLDILRVATGALFASESLVDDTERSQFLTARLRDVLFLAADNSQRLAKLQLKEAFKCVGVEGAYALMHLDNADPEWDVNDHTIFQEPHVKAIQKFRSLSSQLQQETKSKFKANRGRGGRGAGYNQYRRSAFSGGGNAYIRGGKGGRGGRAGGRGGRGGNFRQSGNGRDAEPKDEE